jgi:rsbT antagonist protein RsbS
MSEVLLRIPIIKLHKNLIVSIQIALSDRLVQQLKDDVTTRIQEWNAWGLVIDVSGVDVMDSYLTRSIRDIGMVAKLMGVETIICGLDPMIAMTMVEMGMDLAGVTTKLNLEDALGCLERRHALKKKR